MNVAKEEEEGALTVRWSGLGSSCCNSSCPLVCVGFNWLYQVKVLGNLTWALLMFQLMTLKECVCFEPHVCLCQCVFVLKSRCVSSGERDVNRWQASYVICLLMSDLPPCALNTCTCVLCLHVHAAACVLCILEWMDVWWWCEDISDSRWNVLAESKREGVSFLGCVLSENFTLY